MKPALELRQRQTLAMTAQLQQSIKLLQFSSLELAEYIAAELEKNPLLAIEEGESTPEQDRDQAEAQEIKNADTEEDAPDLDTGRDEEMERDAWNGEAEDAPADLRYAGGGTSRGGDFEDEDSFEQRLERKETLREHLLEQLNVEIHDPVEKIIGAHLIDMVDDAGYIKGDFLPIETALGCTAELIEGALGKLQTFDPPGVCARTVAECLTLQLKDKDRFDPAMEALIAHLDLLAKGDFETLKKRCGVDAEDLQQMVQEIKALDPKPGYHFSADVVQQVIPDIHVRRMNAGGWQVELNSEVLPRVLVNRRYYAQLVSGAREKQAKKYLSDQLGMANWLVKALDQRAHTILKVATEIVAQQEGFLARGIHHLKPLTLKDIAVAVDLHESTISRVTSNKYMATPRGVFELKYFFTSALHSKSQGEDVSSETVRYLIKEMIDNETPDNVLSDDALTEQLQGRGIDVARRTVAKYRELLRIPSSTERRRGNKTRGQIE